jgi:nucleotide-binding universal stress UspA family protein
MEPVPAARTVKFNKILCAVDLGPQSQKIMAWAFQLAADLHAQLGVMHAIASLDPGLPLSTSPQFRMELETMAWQNLEKIQVAAGAASATVHIEAGEPASAVYSFAASSGADLLIIGRRAPDAVTGRLPANAYAIIRESPCPVISL